ncbi:MAG: CdaR family protein [Clostridia bacterium]|nr:CdaR family protein [Clostridia bacterium]
MKNKLSNLKTKLLESEFYKRAPRPVKWVIGSLSNNLGLKMLSLLLAILLWNYVISSDQSITRPKTLFNLTGYVTGTSALNNNKLALAEDPSGALTGIAVTVQAPQANYSKVTSENVQVTLDLSNVRSAGTQRVPLRATSAYGRVQSISPESVSLTFESLDSRNVAVISTLTGDSDDYWYSVSRTNPSMLTVSGAASLVQSIASARVVADVSNMTSSSVSALPYVLLDSSEQVIAQDMLNCSTSSISVSVDVYPCRDIPVSTDPGNLVTGQPAPGYVLKSVTVQPETIQVAAEVELLDGLTELMIEPVSIEGASQSFSAKTSISQLSNFKSISSEQVYVNVNIAEETIDGYVDNVIILFSGKADNLMASYEPVGVYVSGPRSQVEQLQNDGISLTVDVTDREAGHYLIAPTFDAERYPDLTIQSESVSVTLTRVSSEDGTLED